MLIFIFQRFLRDICVNFPHLYRSTKYR
jgi:hypothetical protein